MQTSLEKITTGKKIEDATRGLILLHGRGASAHDILGLVDALDVNNYYVVAPNAPNHIWYPQSFLSDDNEPFLQHSVDAIIDLIDQTTKYIPRENLYIMGFSQGACLTLEVTARSATQYGGIVAFTGGLIGKTLEPKRYSGNFQKTKIFIGTSDQDPYIPLARVQESKAILENLGADLTLKIYPGMGHIINHDEIRFVKDNILS